MPELETDHRVPGRNRKYPLRISLSVLAALALGVGVIVASSAETPAFSTQSTNPSPSPEATPRPEPPITPTARIVPTYYRGPNRTVPPTLTRAAIQINNAAARALIATPVSLPDYQATADSANGAVRTATARADQRSAAPVTGR